MPAMGPSVATERRQRPCSSNQKQFHRTDWR